MTILETAVGEGEKDVVNFVMNVGSIIVASEFIFGDKYDIDANITITKNT